MVDGRQGADDSAARHAPPGRVARLDALTGGEADPRDAPVARLGELRAGDAVHPAADQPADLGRIGTVDRAAAPVADLVVDPQPEPDRPPAPTAQFAVEGIGTGRAGVPVVDLDPTALRPAARGRTARVRRRGGSDGDPRTAGSPGRASGGGRDTAGPDAAPSGRPEPAIDTPARAAPGAAGRSERGRSERSTGRRGATRRAGAREELDPDADPVAVAREICLRLLTERARTRQELAHALRRRGVPDDAAGAVLERFHEVGLIDDAAFAGQWVRSRHTHRGLARRAIAVELRRKGVSEEDAGAALAEVDAESEERRARELVDRKLRTLAVGAPEKRAAAARRLVGMLARKGYGAAVAYRVVKDALAERGAEADELGDAEPPED